MSILSKEQMDQATWPALKRAYDHAERALLQIANGPAAELNRTIAQQALKEMRDEVRACEE